MFPFEPRCQGPAGEQKWTGTSGGDGGGAVAAHLASPVPGQRSSQVCEQEQGLEGGGQSVPDVLGAVAAGQAQEHDVVGGALDPGPTAGFPSLPMTSSPSP
ncbi:hypothetical protein GCM10010327_18110 [Streptomyces nitrosporeus]|nr:hypothetical protein GCM10010327_18110 [Streptomyces nitrosporeus]